MNNPNLGFGQRIFDKTVLKESAVYLNINLIKSLENQTDKDFTLIVLINDRHDKEFIESLIDDTDLHILIIKDSELDNVIKQSVDSTCDYLITTRIDYDDLVVNTAVETCKSKFIRFFKKFNDKMFCVNGFSKGLALVDNRLYIMDKHYRGGGFFSAFVSLCYNLKLSKTFDCLKNVYSLGDHTNLYGGIRNLFKYLHVENSYNDDELEQFIDREELFEYNYIWYRHKNTGSELLNYTPADTSDEISIDKERFKTLFGINLEK